MSSSDKELILKEIDSYIGNESLIEALCSLFDYKKRKKILIDNELGILGNLLDKHKYELDDDIIVRICLRDFIPGEIFDVEQDIFLEDLKSFGFIKDLEYVKREIATDKDYVITRLILGFTEDENDLAAFKKYSSDKDFFLELFRYTNHGYYLQYASDELKKDKELVEKSLTFEYNGFYFADPLLKNDRDYVLELLYKYPKVHIICNLDFSDKDGEYLLECVKQKIKGYELKNNKSVASRYDSCFAVANNICDSNNAIYLFNLLLDTIINKKDDFYYETIMDILNDCLYIFMDREEISRDALLNILRKYPYFDEVIYSYYKNDCSFILDAVKIDLDVCQYIDDSLKNDINFILDLISLGIDITISDFMYKKVNIVYGSLLFFMEGNLDE